MHVPIQKHIYIYYISICTDTQIWEKHGGYIRYIAYSSRNSHFKKFSTRGEPVVTVSTTPFAYSMDSNHSF